MVTIFQAPVVQKVDNAVYLVDHAVSFPNNVPAG